jgi:diacylglycerol kinase (CTP)
MRVGLNQLIPKKNKLDTHWSRKAFHAVSGTLLVVVYLYLLSIEQLAVLALSLAGLLIAFDLLRLKWGAFNQLVLKVYGPLMRAEEVSKPSGQLFYTLGLCFSFLLLPKTLAVQSVLVLAWMDPLASFVGRRFGKTPWNGLLNRVLSGARPVGLDLGVKTLEGSLGGFLFAFLAGIVAWVWVPAIQVAPESYWATAFLFALVGAFVATLAETWPTQWDDNINIPFWTGLSLWLLSRLLGVPV